MNTEKKKCHLLDEEVKDIHKFDENTMVCRYDENGGSYWNGKFNEEGEAIFVPFSDME